MSTFLFIWQNKLQHEALCDVFEGFYVCAPVSHFFSTVTRVHGKNALFSVRHYFVEESEKATE